MKLVFNSRALSKEIKMNILRRQVCLSAIFFFLLLMYSESFIYKNLQAFNVLANALKKVHVNLQ